MITKYFVAFIATLLVSLTAFGADKLCVIFPDTTNLIFTVPIHGNTGARPYDFFLEFPAEYEDDGRPTKFERTGLGYYIFVEVIEETDAGVRCKLKVDCHNLSDWIPYTFGELVMLQPVLSSLSTDTEITLPIGEWYPLGVFVQKNNQLLSWKFLFQREEISQQSGPAYPPQGVGSADP